MKFPRLAHRDARNRLGGHHQTSKGKNECQGRGVRRGGIKAARGAKRLFVCSVFLWAGSLPSQATATCLSTCSQHWRSYSGTG